MNEYEHNKNDWWDLFSAVAFFFTMMTAATRLAATEWVRNLDLVATVILLAIFTGLALGKSIFSRPVVVLFGFSYGIFVIPWQLGLTLGVDIEWSERLSIMADRIRAILLEIVLREEVSDNLFFLLMMATLFWIITVYSGYQLARNGDVWRATIPGGIAIFAIQNYDPYVTSRTWYIAAYIFLTLLILARTYYLRELRRWQEKRTFVPPDAGFDFGRFALLVTLIVVLLAWNSPTFTDSISPVSNLYRMVETPWLEAKEELSFLFASLKATVGLVSDYYADAQPLGRGNVNSDQVVMEINVPNIDYPGHRYYWRARVYDNYQDGRWTSTIENPVEFSPGDDDFSIPDAGEREIIEAEIKSQSALITLYAPSQPIWYSRPGQVNLVPLEDGTVDIINMESSPFIRPGDVYQVKSSIAKVTEKDLREAGEDYPQWIVDRYLQVPENITPRTMLLAERLSEGRDNSYDIARTITFWLRDNIEYIEVIDEPPPEREVIDWFLFEYRKGFCNYYSTSMVLMLRSLGIPARWSVGYAQGTPRFQAPPSGVPVEVLEQFPAEEFQEDQIYIVNQLDAHAWPEVYFPGIGWVEFEPTVSQIAISRPSGENLDLGSVDSVDPFAQFNRDDLPLPDDFPDSFGEDSEIPEETGSGRVSIIIAVLSIVAATTIIIFVWSKTSPDSLRGLWNRILDSVRTPFPVYLETGFKFAGLKPPNLIRRLAYEAKLTPIAKSFLEVNRSLARLNASPKVSATPVERVELLKGLLPMVSEDAQGLLTNYHLEMYSEKQADEDFAIRASEKIRLLSIQVWFERIINRILTPFNRRKPPKD